MSEGITVQTPAVASTEGISAWNLVPFLLSERGSGRILAANGSASELTGYTLEQLRLMTVFDLGLWVSPGQREAILKATPASSPQEEVNLRVSAGAQVVAVHGWQVATAGNAEVVAELMIDVSASVRTRERLERLSRFRGVLSKLLSESLDRGLDDGFYQRVLQGAVETIPGAHTASLLVRGPDNRYRYTAAIGCDLALLKTVSFSEAEMVLEDGGLPLLYRGYRHNSELDQQVRSIINSSGPTQDIQVSIVTPVMLDGEPVAVFNLDNLVDPEAFDAEAQEMALDFARHLAVLLQRFRFEHELWRQANFDALTGLPNRSNFEGVLQEVLDRRLPAGERCAIFFIDLDNFKAVNDTYGHSFGDRLVKAVTDRLEGLLPAAGSLYRWGGDELVALLPQVASLAEAEAAAAQLLSASAEVYDIAGVKVQVTLSVGIATAPEAGMSVAELTRNADVAVYRAKQAGRNTWRVFDEAMRAEVSLQAEVRRAVADSEIFLHYQPRFDLEGRVQAMEALARWQHPERGLLPASAFIAAAEQARVMPQLGAELLNSAVAQSRAWLNEGFEVPVAFNLSGRQLSSAAIVTQIDAVLRRHALPPHLLELQMTETSAVSDAAESSGKLRRLRELGVRLLLDDIGGGFTNMAMLKRFQLDAIKIPREFVQALSQFRNESGTELAAEDVVSAVVSLGRDLGVQVVAEGVETDWQYAFLREIGVTRVQGFLFSDALSPAEATELLLRQDSGS